MKTLFIATVGTVGALINLETGWWNNVLFNLIVLMALDYLSAIILATVFKNAGREAKGLDSGESYKGLIKKGMMLALVMVANILDRVFLDATFATNATIIALMTNETISIIENIGLMGVPIPKVIRDAIHVLNERSENELEKTN